MREDSSSLAYVCSEKKYGQIPDYIDYI